MVDVLWDEVVASSSMTDLAGRLASYPLDSLPSFAAFFWTADGMRSLVRGAVSVVDLASGVTVAEGEGIQTWSEVGLGQVSQVLVDVQTAGNGARQELPLVVGAVRASSVRLDASEGARVRSPQVPVVAAQAPAEDDSADVPDRGAARRRRVGVRRGPARTPSRPPRTPRTGPGTPPSPRRARRRGLGPSPTRGFGVRAGRRRGPGRGWRPSGRLSPAAGATPRHPSPWPSCRARRPSSWPTRSPMTRRPQWQPDEWSPDQWNPEDGTGAGGAPDRARAVPAGARTGGAGGRRAGRPRPRRSGHRVPDVGARPGPGAGPGAAAGRRGGDGERRHPADAAALPARDDGDGGLTELADHGRGLPVRPRQCPERHQPAGSAAARSPRRVRSCCRGRSWRCCGPPTAARPRSTARSWSAGRRRPSGPAPGRRG